MITSVPFSDSLVAVGDQMDIFTSAASKMKKKCSGKGYRIWAEVGNIKTELQTFSLSGEQELAPIDFE
jgi:hypothetical protein